jgi:glutathione S-transferase
MITIHHLRIGRSIFTVWLLEELGLDYDLKDYRRDPETFRAPPELREVHPLGKSPVIVDGDQTIAESGAIAQYLLETYDTGHKLGVPPGDAARAQFLQWLHYPEGSAFAPLLMTMLLQRAQTPDHPIAQFAAGEVALQLGFMSDSLGEGPYIMGERFTAADIGFGYIASMAGALGLLENYPLLAAYVERLTARPAFKAAKERAVE